MLRSIPKHMLMSYNNTHIEYSDIEILPHGGGRRRRWSTDAKLVVVEKGIEPGETVSRVARHRGAAPTLLYRRRKLMSGGGSLLQ